MQAQLLAYRALVLGEECDAQASLLGAPTLLGLRRWVGKVGLLDTMGELLHIARGVRALLETKNIRFKPPRSGGGGHSPALAAAEAKGMSSDAREFWTRHGLGG